jgi:hypothetical protein
MLPEPIKQGQGRQQRDSVKTIGKQTLQTKQVAAGFGPRRRVKIMTDSNR